VIKRNTQTAPIDSWLIDTVNIVLLPGLDGTGELFSRFEKALSGAHEVKTIVYPFKEGLGYEVLTEYVHDVLPTEQAFVLLGESFSGPIAVTVAAGKVPNLKGLILVNTFLENPRPLLLKFMDFIPDRLVFEPPKAILQWLLKNAEQGAVDAEELRSTISSLSPSLVRTRLSSVAKVAVHAQASKVDVPVCILRSERDAAISQRIASQVIQTFKKSTVQKFNTNHFLLQSMPNQAAQVVEEFIHSRCL